MKTYRNIKLDSDVNDDHTLILMMMILRISQRKDSRSQ